MMNEKDKQTQKTNSKPPAPPSAPPLRVLNESFSEKKVKFTSEDNK